MPDLPNLILSEVNTVLAEANPLLVLLIERVIADFEARIKAESDEADEIACELDRVRKDLAAEREARQYQEAGSDDSDTSNNLRRAVELNDRLQAEIDRLNLLRAGKRIGKVAS